MIFLQLLRRFVLTFCLLNHFKKSLFLCCSFETADSRTAHYLLRTESLVSASLSVINKPRSQYSPVAWTVKKYKQNPDCSEISNSKSDFTIPRYRNPSLDFGVRKTMLKSNNMCRNWR